jgi:XRE family transcriptional regulator, fatty acid utilization regulator
MTQEIISQRLRALREEKGLSQDELSRIFGFKDRQTVSAIETGERKMSAEELLVAVEKLDVSLDFFIDPFRLVGEGGFNWRQTNVVPSVLDGYERTAGRFIAAFRALAPKTGHELPLLRRRLGLTKLSRFEDAMTAGERFAEEFKLGDVPALKLVSTMEADLAILVLMVDAIVGISGAACRLPELDVVMINRHEVEGRRHFDLAHELFHILTWDAMPPERVEETNGPGRSRIEQLADMFASAVLMPKSALKPFGEFKGLAGKALEDKLNTTADALHVSSMALKWRLASLGDLTQPTAKAVPDTALRNNGRTKRPAEIPPALFSRTFVTVLAKALDLGQLSMRKAADLVSMSIDDLEALFSSHGVDAPYSL